MSAFPWRKFVWVQDSLSVLRNRWSKHRVVSESPLIVEYYEFGGKSVMFLLPEGSVEGEPDRKWRRP